VNVIVLHLVRRVAVTRIAIAALEIGAIQPALKAVAFVAPHEQENLRTLRNGERRSASPRPVANPGWPRTYTTPAGAPVQIYHRRSRVGKSSGTSRRTWPWHISRAGLISKCSGR
jgi:hypothetical protein